MIAVLLLSVSVTAVSALETEAGTTVTVSFSVPNAYGVDGSFSYSNRGLFSGVSYRNNSALGGSCGDTVYLYSNDGNTSNVTIVLTLTVRANAQAGESCSITFTYEVADANGQMSSWKNQSQTVSVKAKPVVTTAETTKAPETTSEKPDTDKPAPPQTSTQAPPQPPVTKEEASAPGVDYTELQRQIKIADSLNETDYTIDSWDAMKKAYNEGVALLKSNDQKAVDAGASSLEKAIAALVKINTADLRKSVEAAKAMFDDTRASGKLWEQLFASLAKADDVLKSRDQKKIDDLNKEISDLIDQIKKDAEENAQVKEVVKEVEVLPDGEYCNIHIHKVWPILFFISLGINVILIGLIIAFFAKRKKNEKDDTPVVDYDIGDDA